MIALTFKRWNREKTILGVLLAAGLVGGAMAFNQSYLSNLNVVIGLCLMPLSVFVQGAKRNNVAYIILSLAFAVLALMYGVRICYFFALAFYLLWAIERFAGQLNTLVLFLMVFMSPFFIQVVTILGFPLRLALSHYAGSALNMMGANVIVHGNVMTMNGTSFSVDDACMGLNMLAVSMLMGVFILGYHYRQSSKNLALYSLIIFFSVVFVINMLMNMIRIIVLVYFHVLPENPMHDLIGVLCLVCYVMMPLHFLGRWFVVQFGKNRSIEGQHQLNNTLTISSSVILSTTILFAGVFLENTREARHYDHARVEFASMTGEQIDGGVTKISIDNLLIYVKAIPEFFTGEHTPLMCWTGSGYAFSGVTTTAVSGITVYKGVLVKEGTRLHTAWWYSNGEVETISQVDWRWRMLKGEAKFCLVNVTAADEATLMNALHAMFTTSPIKINSNKL